MSLGGEDAKTTEKVERGDLILLQEYIQLFWDFLPIPVCDINGAFVIINVGREFLDFFGYSKVEIVGEPIKKIFLDEKEFKRFKEELIKKKKISREEFVVLTKKGERRPVLISASPREEKKIIISYFVAFIDIKEVKEKERKLKEKIEELENFQRWAVGRELKMVELKEEIERLKKELKKKN